MLSRSGKSLYKVTYSSFIRFVAISIAAILLISYIIIDYMFIHTLSNKAVFSAESNSRSLENTIQDDITLCYSLSENTNLIYNLRMFRQGNSAQQIDADTNITNFLNNYWFSHPEIANIRIFLTDYVSSYAFKSISYVEQTNTDWAKFFRDSSAFIITEYGPESDVALTKNKNLIAIFVPIIVDGDTTLGFLCANISKSVLYSKFKNLYDPISAPMFLADNNGNIISPDTVAFDTYTVPQSALSRASSSYSTARLSGKKYLVSSSSSTKQGWKVIQYVPYSYISCYRLPIIAVYLLFFGIFLSLAVTYSKRKTKILTAPINRLSEAMATSSVIEYDDMPNEIENVYKTYNDLLIKNSNLISQVKNTEGQKNEAEIKSLLAQISPHFLYNTLNTISWKAFNAEQQEICTIIGKLSKLCKMNYNFKSIYSTLQSELIHINLYMELQQLCINTEFSFTIAVPDEYLNFEIPKFILQPLIENTIIHGFSQINYKGTITIKATADELLEISITDNGCGIEAITLEKLNSNSYYSEKYGIQNLNERIKLLYGQEYGITFSSNGYNFTSALIRLPIRIADTSNTRNEYIL